MDFKYQQDAFTISILNTVPIAQKAITKIEKNKYALGSLDLKKSFVKILKQTFKLVTTLEGIPHSMYFAIRKEVKNISKLLTIFWT